MKKLSKNIKRALILTAFSCASVCIMPNILCDVMPICTASEVSASDEERIIQELQQEAEAGDAEAQYKLGNRYYYGKYTEENYGKAVYWYLQAAKQGDVASQIILAECYSWRNVLPRNKKLEIYWYTKAAEQNNINAQYQLADYYYHSKYHSNNKQSLEKAVYWYQKAAEQGSGLAQYNLGSCYEEGIGVEQDYEKAVYWYTKSAEQGYYEAQESLARCYSLGIGVEKDETKSAYWDRLVAEKGFDYVKDNFRYSILDIYKSTVDDETIIGRESWWKEVLLTRNPDFGYNAN